MGQHKQSGYAVGNFMTQRNEAVACPAGVATEIVEMPVGGRARLGLEISNKVGGGNLSAVSVQFQFEPAGAWIEMAADAKSYSDPSYPVVKASENLPALAAGASGWLSLDVSGAFMVKIVVTATGTDATVSVYSTASSR